LTELLPAKWRSGHKETRKGVKGVEEQRKVSAAKLAGPLPLCNADGS
jgi:hypothetical protein